MGVVIMCVDFAPHSSVLPTNLPHAGWELFRRIMCSQLMDWDWWDMKTWKWCTCSLHALSTTDRPSDQPVCLSSAFIFICYDALLCGASQWSRARARSCVCVPYLINMYRIRFFTIHVFNSLYSWHDTLIGIRQIIRIHVIWMLRSNSCGSRLAAQWKVQNQMP